MIYTRPQPGEYAPYYDRYISLIEGTDLLSTLDAQRGQMAQLFAGRDDAQADFRYASGKWSAKEVLGHICDGERVFTYRALRIARGDQTPLAGFDENEYAKASPAGRRPLADLLEEYTAVRASTIALLRGFDEEAWLRRGTTNNSPASVRALGYIIAGHDAHHQRIFQEKYFAAH